MDEQDREIERQESEISLPEGEDHISDPETSPGDSPKTDEREDQEENEETKKKQSQKTISKLQREKYRALEKTRHLEEEVERLRHVAASADQTVLSHADENIKLQLDRAKRNKIQAFEDGDAEAMANADYEIAQIAAQEAQLKLLHMSRQAPSQHIPEPSPYAKQDPVDLNEESATWVRKNPWIVQDSPDFDPEKAAAVQAFAKALDLRLMRQGREHEYLKKPYFDQVDHFMRNYDGEEPMPPKVMQPNPGITAVRNANGFSPPPKERITLSADEKFMARNAGVSEEAWIRAKKMDIQKQKERGSRYYE